MVNINKNSTRSITPTNLSKRTSNDFLNRSLNMKQTNGKFSETNASFSNNNLTKTGGFNKSPSAYKDFGNKTKSSIKVSKDVSLDRNLSANKSFDKSKEGFNPKSTLRIGNKSPMSSRSNIKKTGNNVSISTNASPIFKNNKNIGIPNTSKSPIDNSIIKNFNDIKNKNASPIIYNSFIKKIHKGNNLSKKIPTPSQIQTNSNNNINNNSGVNNNLNNSPVWNNNNNNINKNSAKNSNNSSNMNSNDLSTNHTSGLNSNNNLNNLLGNIKNNGNTNQTNDGDYIYQIQPKYEEENRPSNKNSSNNLNFQKSNQPINNVNFSNQNQNFNNPFSNRENKFLNNNNNHNIDFKTMNTSPLLRVFLLIYVFLNLEKK